MKPIKEKKLEDKTDWKALALETGNKLAWAVARLKAPGAIVSFDDKGNFVQKNWEDDVCETLMKFPGAKIDREALSEKYLSPSERKKLYAKRAKEKAKQ